MIHWRELKRLITIAMGGYGTYVGSYLAVIYAIERKPIGFGVHFAMALFCAWVAWRYLRRTS